MSFWSLISFVLLVYANKQVPLDPVPRKTQERHIRKMQLFRDKNKEQTLIISSPGQEISPVRKGKKKMQKVRFSSITNRSEMIDMCINMGEGKNSIGDRVER